MHKVLSGASRYEQIQQRLYEDFFSPEALSKRKKTLDQEREFRKQHQVRSFVEVFKGKSGVDVVFLLARHIPSVANAEEAKDPQFEHWFKQLDAQPPAKLILECVHPKLFDPGVRGEKWMSEMEIVAQHEMVKG